MILKLLFLNNVPKVMQQYHCQQDLASFPVLYQKFPSLLYLGVCFFLYTFSGAPLLCSWHLAIWLARLMPFNMAKSCSVTVWSCVSSLPPLYQVLKTPHTRQTYRPPCHAQGSWAPAPLLHSLQPWRPQAPAQTSCDNSVTEKWNITSDRESTL